MKSGNYLGSVTNQSIQEINMSDTPPKQVQSDATPLLRALNPSVPLVLGILNLSKETTVYPIIRDMCAIVTV